MQGTMLWFNVDKGYGFINTEQGERLKVARSGFRPGHPPQPRCKGKVVTFQRQVGDDEACAVDVAFEVEAPSRRARLRRSRGGSTL